MKIIDKAVELLGHELSKDILKRYHEEHRFYHTLEHLNDIYDQLKHKGLEDNEALLLATLFHDIIYDPRSATNEEDSARYFNDVFNGDELLKKKVIQIILDTKNHQSQKELSRTFCEVDLNILTSHLIN